MPSRWAKWQGALFDVIARDIRRRLIKCLRAGVLPPGAGATPRDFDALVDFNAAAAAAVANSPAMFTTTTSAMAATAAGVFDAPRAPPPPLPSSLCRAPPVLSTAGVCAIASTWAASDTRIASEAAAVTAATAAAGAAAASSSRTRSGSSAPARSPAPSASSNSSPAYAMWLPRALSLDPCVDLRPLSDTHVLCVQLRLLSSLLRAAYPSGSSQSAAAHALLLPSLLSALWHPSSDVVSGAITGLVDVCTSSSPCHAPGLLVHCIAVVRAAGAQLADTPAAVVSVPPASQATLQHDQTSGGNTTTSGAPPSLSAGATTAAMTTAAASSLQPIFTLPHAATTLAKSGGESSAFADAVAILERDGSGSGLSGGRGGSASSSSSSAAASAAASTAAPGGSSGGGALRKFANVFSLRGGGGGDAHGSASGPNSALAARLLLSAVAGPDAVPALTSHSASSPVHDSLPGGVGAPGGGRGSGSGVLSGGPAALARALMAHARAATAIILALASDRGSSSSSSDCDNTSNINGSSDSGNGSTMTNFHRSNACSAAPALPLPLLHSTLSCVCTLLDPSRPSSAAAAAALADARLAGASGGVAAAAAGLSSVSTSSLAALGASAALEEMDAAIVRAGCALLSALAVCRVTIVGVVPAASTTSTCGRCPPCGPTCSSFKPSRSTTTTPFISLPSVWPRVHALLGLGLLLARSSLDHTGVGSHADGSGALALYPLGPPPFLSDAIAASAAAAVLGAQVGRCCILLYCAYAHAGAQVGFFICMH